MFTILAIFGSASVLILLVGRSTERPAEAQSGPMSTNALSDITEEGSVLAEPAAESAPAIKPSFMNVETRAERRSRRLEEMSSQLKVDELIAEMEMEMVVPKITVDQKFSDEPAVEHIDQSLVEHTAAHTEAEDLQLRIEEESPVAESGDNVAKLPVQVPKAPVKQSERVDAPAKKPGLQIFEPGDWRQQAHRSA